MSFGDQWGAATVGENDRSDPPEPGIYQVAVTDAKAFTAKSGSDYLIVELRIVSGHGIGHEWSLVANLSTEGGVKAAKNISARLGLPIEHIASLEDLDREVKIPIGSYFEVEVVQKGEWRNTYIKGPATADVSDVTPAEPASVGAAQSTVDDDIPFAPSVI